MTIILFILRLFGFAGWAETVGEQAVKKKRAQDEANIPVTDDEWTQSAKKDDL